MRFTKFIKKKVITLAIIAVLAVVVVFTGFLWQKGEAFKKEVADPSVALRTALIYSIELQAVKTTNVWLAAALDDCRAVLSHTNLRLFRECLNATGFEGEAFDYCSKKAEEPFLECQKKIARLFCGELDDQSCVSKLNPKCGSIAESFGKSWEKIKRANSILLGLALLDHEGCRMPGGMLEEMRERRKCHESKVLLDFVNLREYYIQAIDENLACLIENENALPLGIENGVFKLMTADFTSNSSESRVYRIGLNPGSYNLTKYAADYGIRVSEVKGFLIESQWLHGDVLEIDKPYMFDFALWREGNKTILAVGDKIDICNYKSLKGC